jgi:hypothetical protein
MPSGALESSEVNRTTCFNRSGTIVLSSTFRLLFMDQRAIELMATLDSDIYDPPLTEAFPSCLMRLAQDIAAMDSLRSDGSCSWFEQKSRLVGSLSYPVQVRGFSVPGRDREDGRILLVLSCRHQEAAPWLHAPSTSTAPVRDTGVSPSDATVEDCLSVKFLGQAQ